MRTLFETKTRLPGETASRFRSPAVYFGLLSVLAAGLLLRLHQLAVKGLYDEAASWTFASLDWEPFWEVMWRYEGNMVFYYVLLRGWLHLGDSEFVLRSLSVLFGIAALLALYRLGSRLFGGLTGLLAAALLAVHALHIEYSQDARSYSLLVFLIIVSCHCFIDAVRQPQRKRFWAAYIIVSALAFYSHIFAVLVLAAQWLSLDLARLRRIGFAKLAILGAVLTAFLLPGIIFVLTSNQGQLQWTQPLSWDLVSSIARAFTGDGGVYLSALYFVTAIVGIDRKDWRMRLTIGWLFGPIVALIFFSLFTPLLTARLVLMCLPALALLSARGLVRLAKISVPWTYASTVVLALLMVLSVRGDSRYFGYARASGASFGPMTRYILNRSTPDDGIFFFTAATHMSFNYYAEQHDLQHGSDSSAAPEIVFPSFGETPTGAQPTPTKAEVQAAVQGHSRVWLVLNNSSIGLVRDRQAAARMIRETLESDYRVADEKHFSESPSCTVLLFVRRSDVASTRQTSQRPDDRTRYGYPADFS